MQRSELEHSYKILGSLIFFKIFLSNLTTNSQSWKKSIWTKGKVSMAYQLVTSVSQSILNLFPFSDTNYPRGLWTFIYVL